MRFFLVKIFKTDDWSEESEQSTLPGESSNTGQFRDIPDTDQGVCTTGGKVLSLGVKLDTDTVSRVGIQSVLEFQIWIAVKQQRWTCIKCNQHPSTDSDFVIQ